MNHTTHHALSELFDPMLALDDPALYVERVDNPLDRLREARVSTRPMQGLLVGALGTGKSTELRRLARRLARDPNPPVTGFVPLNRQCDLSQLTAPQVLILVGFAALKLAPVAPPSKVTRALDEAWKGVVEPSTPGASLDTTELFKTLIVQASGLLPAPAASLGTALAAAIQELPQLPIPGRGRRLQLNDPPVEKAVDAVREAVEWARSVIQPSPMVLMVDGLDKITPDAVGVVFADSLLARPRVDGFQVIYAAPYSLYFSVQGRMLEQEFCFLPIGNFRVFKHRPDGETNPDGFEALRRLVATRLKRADIRAEDVFEGGLTPGGPVDDLIRISGGVPRTLVRLLARTFRRAVALGAKGPVGPADVATVIADEEKSVVRSLSLQQEFVPAVLDSWKTSRPPAVGAFPLIHHNLILAYANDFDWFRPAPALLRYLRREFPADVPPEPPQTPAAG